MDTGGIDVFLKKREKLIDGKFGGLPTFDADSFDEIEKPGYG